MHYSQPEKAAEKVPESKRTLCIFKQYSFFHFLFPNKKTAKNHPGRNSLPGCVSPENIQAPDTSGTILYSVCRPAGIDRARSMPDPSARGLGQSTTFHRTQRTARGKQPVSGQRKIKSCGGKDPPQPYFCVFSESTFLRTGRKKRIAAKAGLLTYASTVSAGLLRILPMTDFHLKQDLRVYSGGTVPDFHRISYSLPCPIGPQQHFRAFSLTGYSILPGGRIVNSHLLFASQRFLFCLFFLNFPIKSGGPEFRACKLYFQ